MCQNCDGLVLVFEYHVLFLFVFSSDACLSVCDSGRGRSDFSQVAAEATKCPIKYCLSTSTLFKQQTRKAK